MARPRASRRNKNNVPSEESFGQRLARLRKQRGLTQIELAERVGMIQALISDYERGKLRPYADVAVRFAQALEVSTDELLGLAAPPKERAPERPATPAPAEDRRAAQARPGRAHPHHRRVSRQERSELTNLAG